MRKGTRLAAVTLVTLVALLTAPGALAQDPSDEIYPDVTPPPTLISGGGGGGGESALGAESSQSNLPFTGAELGLFAAVGLVLIASGVILRRTSRNRS